MRLVAFEHLHSLELFRRNIEVHFKVDRFNFSKLRYGHEHVHIRLIQVALKLDQHLHLRLCVGSRRHEFDLVRLLV